MLNIIIAIILIYIVGLIIVKLIKVFGKIFLFMLSISLCAYIIKLLINNFGIVISILKYALIGLIGISILGCIITIISKIKFKLWLNQSLNPINKWQVEDVLRKYLDEIYSKDKNNSAKFKNVNLPYGRINSFLNYHGTSIENDDPIYYSAERSMQEMELREYGTVITFSGIYISKQLTELDDNKNNIVLNEKIPFSGIYNTELNSNYLIVRYAKKDKLETVQISSSDTTLPLDVLKKLCDELKSQNISLAMYQNKIIDGGDFEDALNKANNNFDLKDKENINAKINILSGVVAENKASNIEMKNTKNLMNGSRGHGYAAEYANNTIDKLSGKKVVNAAQDLDENGRQVKHGADRIVNGVNIQTKYYKTAKESIGAVFENKQSIYVNQDGTMMQIEVPKDQYYEACKEMQKRIDKGQVSGAKPGDDARKYVRKGALTYEQAFNLCKSGSIESLTIDTINGAITSTMIGGITAITTFAFSIWNGKNVEEAVKSSLKVGINVIGRGAAIYTLTMQLSRSEFINPLIKQYTKDGVCQGFKGIKNPIYSISEDIANNVCNSSIAQSQIGQSLGLKNIKGNQVISSGVTAMFIFGPDICRALRGRISAKQLFKNTTIGVSGLLGGALGQTLIPIPYLGGIIGAGLSSFVTKKVLDNYIEDDAKEMFQILKEEFIDVVMLANLTKKEFKNVVNKTLCSENLSDILQEMYASGEARNFAREALVSVAVINEISKRKKITNEMINEGIKKLTLSITNNTSN